MRPFRLLGALLAASLAIAPTASARHAVHLRVPRFSVPPHSDREICTFVALPMKKGFDLSANTVANVGIKSDFTTHHFLLWTYQGTDIAAFPAKGVIQESKACIDFGPNDTNDRALIVGSQSPVLKTKLPDGIAQQLKPTVSGGKPVVGFILNSHWINSSDRTQFASVKITLVAAKRHTVKQWLLPIFDVFANVAIDVPPGAVRTESGDWGPGTIDFGGVFGGGSVPKGPACVIGLTSHMHKRGKLFTIDLMDNGVPTKRLLDNTSYSDPLPVAFPSNVWDGLIKPGQTLHYTCTHDNGVTTEQKMGCEEQPGVVPGVDVAKALFKLHENSGAAKRCATDADCAGFGTGKCVPANLVFGFTSDDDMCIMPGGYYPANAQGNCDLSGLPTLN